MQDYDFKKDFPIFQNVTPYGKPLIYLDNAASAQKPACVIEAMKHNLEFDYANVHRGVHYLANQSTIAFENARKIAQKFVNAKRLDEIIFISGATDGFNLLADSLGADLKEGDEIILSISEHHSNIVPWHFLRERKGCVIKWVNLTENGDIDLEHYQSLLTEKVKIVSITHMSNVLGKINPIKEMAHKAHEVGAIFIADGSQGAVHSFVDVQELGIDFYVVTGHKLYGPSGVGFVWGNYERWEVMRPYRGGGEMIETVTMDNVTYNTPPHRFEAGTPAITQVIGLGRALEYMLDFDRDALMKDEQELTAYAFERLSNVQGLKIYGDLKDRAGVIAFNLQGLHPHDVSTYIDRKGIAIRAGHHCASPLMKYLGTNATMRASFAIYNIKTDIDELVKALEQAKDFFS